MPSRCERSTHGFRTTRCSGVRACAASRTTSRTREIALGEELMSPTSTNDSIVQTIEIRARAERIFQALTDPAQRIQWWGAEGRFQATHMESDLRPGGTWEMRGNAIGGKHSTVRRRYE